ncbi:MAG: DNA primase [Nitrospirae bacterium GWC2_57_13]|nr:MAG: DNA primase [Nitrospirae bacterium GWC2_57_13]
MYSEDVIHRVRDSVDIVDLVSGYVSLKKTGKNYVGLCPFHTEKTPSFTVNPDKQIFHCFGCGAGGDAFKFIGTQEGLNFPEAMRRLAERSGVALPEDQRSRQEDAGDREEREVLRSAIAEAEFYFRRELEGPAGAAASDYLKRRGVSEVAAKDFSLGYARPEWDGLLRHLTQKGIAPALLEKAGLVVQRSSGDGYYDRFRGRIIFPIRDVSGTVIAFGGRVMDDTLPKYLNSPETPLYSKSNVLFGLDRAKEAGRKLGYFIIVEGYLDALACHQFGVQNAVATLGTALTEGHLRLLRRFAKKVVLIFDPDPAGVKAALRGLDLFATSGMKVNVVSLPDGEDPDTFLHRRGRDAFTEQLRGSVKFMEFVLGQVARGGRKAPIDEKVERAGEMLGFIAKLPSAIERDHYLKRTAEAFDLDEGLLRREMPSGGPTRQTADQPRSAVPAHQRPRAEEMLIHLMLREDGIARDLQGQLSTDDFTDPLYRRAAERIFSVVALTGRLESAALLQGDDEELNHLISHYSVLDLEYQDPGRAQRDCVERLRQQGLARKMKEIGAAVKEAEARGDQERLRSLLDEQRRLAERRTREDRPDAAGS